VKKELDHDDNHLHLDETTKLLQDLHEAQADRAGSRPSSNLSSLSNTSERDQHHLGKVTCVTEVKVLVLQLKLIKTYILIYISICMKLL